MNLTVDRYALGDALARIQRVVEKRSTQPGLANVLLYADNDELRLTATDTEVTYIGQISATVTQPGTIAVDADALFRIARKLPSNNVHIALVEGSRLCVESGQARFELVAISASEYPPLPPFEAREQITLSSRDLARVLRETSFCVASEALHWGLNGALIESEKAADGVRLRFAATDRHRLAVSEARFEGSVKVPSNVLVPKKALSVLEALLDGDDDRVELAFGEGALQLVRGNNRFWFRLLDGEFPNYRAIIGSSFRTTVVIDRAALDAALDRVNIVVTDRARPVRFAFDDHQLVLVGDNTDRGNVREELPCEIAGPGITIGFNPRYVREILRVINSQRVSIELEQALVAARITDPDRDDAYFIVMPMRLAD